MRDEDDPKEVDNWGRGRWGLFTCREGHEVVTLPEGPVFVQEMLWVKFCGVWKLFAVVQRRGQDREDDGALRRGKISGLCRLQFVFEMRRFLM